MYERDTSLIAKSISFISSVLGSLLACIFGGVEFEVLGREARFSIEIGVCYYLQVIIPGCLSTTVV